MSFITKIIVIAYVCELPGVSKSVKLIWSYAILPYRGLDEWNDMFNVDTKELYDMPKKQMNTKSTVKR